MTIVSVLSFETVGISHRSVVELDTPAPSCMTSCWAQVCNVKVSPATTIVFNDVKSELCLHLVFQSMFLTQEESYVLAHQFAAASKHKHNLASFYVSEPFIQVVN